MKQKGRTRRGRWKAGAGIWRFGSKILHVLCPLPPCHGPICLPALLTGVWASLDPSSLLAAAYCLALALLCLGRASSREEPVALPTPRLAACPTPSHTTAQSSESQMFASHLSSLPRLVGLVSTFKGSPLWKETCTKLNVTQRDCSARMGRNNICKVLCLGSGASFPTVSYVCCVVDGEGKRDLARGGHAGSVCRAV